MKEEEVQKLIERLEDRPEDLYLTIQGRQAAKNKFTLIDCARQNKENGDILKYIENKKKYYENEFKTLLKGRKTETLKILLPKLESVRSIFKDDLHKLKMKERSSDIIE